MVPEPVHEDSGPEDAVAADVRAAISEVDCATNSAADVTLLRAGSVAFRVAILADRAVSVGSGVEESAPYLGRARAAGLSVVRRSSGGTGVLHAPGDLAWSIVLPRGHPLAGRDFVRAYPRLGEGVVRWLSDLGVSAAWTGPLGRSTDYCLLSARGHVLSVGERVLGGAAQHLSGSSLLHHGILPLEVDRTAVTRLFGLDEDGTTDRLTSLRELGIRGSPRRLAEGLAAAIARQLGTFPPPG